MPHADEGRLHAYLDGALHAESPEEARALERHLEGCDDCRALLEFERAVRDEAAELLTAAVPPTAAAAPPWDEILHRAGRAMPARGGSAPDRDRQGPAQGDGSAHGSGDGRDRGAARRPGYPWLPAGRRLAWAASVVVALGVGWWAHAALGVGPFGASVPRGHQEAETAADVAVPAFDDAAASARDGVAPGRNAVATQEADATQGATPPLDEAIDVEAEAAPGARHPREDALRSEDAVLSRFSQARDPARGAAGPDAAEAVAAAEAEVADSDDGDAGAADVAMARADSGRDAAGAAGGAAGGAAKEGKEPAAPIGELRMRAEAAAPAFVPERFEREAAAWTAVDLAEARSLLGHPPVGVPGADVVEIAWGAGGGTLRVTQRLPSGERLDLYQWPANRAGAGGPVFSGEAVDPANARERGEVQSSPRAQLSMVAVDGLLVAGSGLVEPALLRALLQRLEPLE